MGSALSLRPAYPPVPACARIIFEPAQEKVVALLADYRHCDGAKGNMNVVYKYTLDQDTVLDLPFGTQVLTVGMQGEEMRMWALVPDSKSTLRRRFIVVATGERFADSAYNHGYVGTVFHNGLVFHVFEVRGEA